MCFVCQERCESLRSCLVWIGLVLIVEVVCENRSVLDGETCLVYTTFPCNLVF